MSPMQGIILRAGLPYGGGHRDARERILGSSGVWRALGPMEHPARALTPELPLPPPHPNPQFDPAGLYA